MTRRIQAALFDVAGTLLLLREPVGVCYARIARSHGVTLPAARLDEAFARVFAAAPANVHPGQPMWKSARLEREWWRARLRETFRAADQSVCFNNFNTFYDEVWAHYASPAAWRVADGAREALSKLAASGVLLGALSNFDQRLRPLLTAFELHACFDAVTTPADAGAAKPDRAIFDVCLKRLNTPAPRALYIGNQAAGDIEAARAAGLHAIAVEQIQSLAALPDEVARIEASE